MQVLKKVLKKFFIKFWPLLLIISLVGIFFWKFFILGKVPIPGDFITGVYYPWLDYKWGYGAGVPVKNPITTDVVSLIYPEQILAVDLMKSGKWPLWNPYILAGTPLLANLQSAPFSPTVFIYFLLDNVSAWSMQVILQHFFSIIFMFLLLRYWKLSRVAALFGGVVFAFSGFNLIFSQWNGHTLASSFIPLAVLFTHKWLEKRKFIDGLGLSLIFTMQLFSGYPQTCLYTAIILVILWLVHVLFKKQLVNDIKSIFLLLPFIILALGLSAIQLIPAAELWKLSQRGFEPNTFEWAFLPWSKLITFIAPDFFGNHSTYNYWGPQDYTSNTAYIGIVATFFTIAGIRLYKKYFAVKFLLISVIITLILSFPTPVSIFLWKHDILGMLSSSAHRATVLYIFSAGALSAYGLDDLLKKKDSSIRIKDLLILYLIIFVYGLWAFWKFKTVDDASIVVPIIGYVNKYMVGIRNLILPLLILVCLNILLLINNILQKNMDLTTNKQGSGIKMFKCNINFLNKKYINKIIFVRRSILIFFIFSLMVFELFRFGWKYTPFSERELIYPTTPVLDYLINETKPFRTTGNLVIPDNMRSVYKIESLEGYETIHPLRISQFIAALNSGRSGTTPVGRYGSINSDTSKLLDLVNTKYYLTLKLNEKNIPDINGKIPERFVSSKFEKVFEDKSVSILKSKDFLPRAFFVYDWTVENDDKKIINTLLDNSFVFSKRIILEKDIPYIKDEDIGVIQNNVEYLKYGDQDSELLVYTNVNGLLFLSEAFFPGWKAYIDGQLTEIYRADFSFRAIVIPAGTHHISFIYDPLSFKIGKWISMSTLLFLFSFLFYVQINKKISNSNS
jgi:Bacterial membrane protein YfhO